jgi:hypothetical protein
MAFKLFKTFKPLKNSEIDLNDLNLPSNGHKGKFRALNCSDFAFFISSWCEKYDP